MSAGALRIRLLLVVVGLVGCAFLSIPVGGMLALLVTILAPVVALVQRLRKQAARPWIELCLASFVALIVMAFAGAAGSRHPGITQGPGAHTPEAAPNPALPVAQEAVAKVEAKDVRSRPLDPKGGVQTLAPSAPNPTVTPDAGSKASLSSASPPEKNPKSDGGNANPGRQAPATTYPPSSLAATEKGPQGSAPGAGNHGRPMGEGGLATQDSGAMAHSSAPFDAQEAQRRSELVAGIQCAQGALNSGAAATPGSAASCQLGLSKAIATDPEYELAETLSNKLRASPPPARRPSPRPSSSSGSSSGHNPDSPGRALCCDGTHSATCGCGRATGCCSRHGGVCGCSK